jgi:hypothetical protein
MGLVMTRNLLGAVFLSVFLLEPASSIVVRHDVPDSKYRVERDRFPATAFFHLGGVFGHGTGTLIHPQWVLTAAHLGRGLKAGGRVTVGEKDYRIKRSIVHPDFSWKPFKADLALVELDRRVEGIEPAQIYKDEDELGQHIWFVGAGRTGDGQNSLADDDHKIRAAQNTVTEVRERWLVFQFNQPPEGLPLEGISGPGDSGGPAYLERSGKWYTLGVSSWQDSSKQGNRQGVYGVFEYYTRVSSFADWVHETISAE